MSKTLVLLAFLLALTSCDTPSRSYPVSGSRSWDGPPSHRGWDPPPPGPASEYYLIPGRWVRHGRWIWVEGHWVSQRYRSFWVPGQWRERGDHWQWEGGYWLKRIPREELRAPVVPPPDPAIRSEPTTPGDDGAP